jgi:hypothetical protein
MLPCGPLGIKVSPRTCGRIMAKHRALYGWDKPKGPAKPKKDMPFKASRRHEYWSIDVRYIEHHQLPNVKGPVYVMSVLLASILSEKQDTAAYLWVLAIALRNYGVTSAIVTDGGGLFYSLRALAIYEALDIRKERIDPRQSWQNYIEAHFGIMRRLAGYYLNRALTWDEMKKAHRKFIRDYNTQIHFAHRERRDNRHSLKACAPGSACAHGRSFNLRPYLLRNALYPPSGSIRIHPFPQVANLSGSRASPRNQ